MIRTIEMALLMVMLALMVGICSLLIKEASESILSEEVANVQVQTQTKEEIEGMVFNLEKTFKQVIEALD